MMLVDIARFQFPHVSPNTHAGNDGDGRGRLGTVYTELATPLEWLARLELHSPPYPPG